MQPSVVVKTGHNSGIGPRVLLLTHSTLGLCEGGGGESFNMADHFLITADNVAELRREIRGLKSRKILKSYKKTSKYKIYVNPCGIVFHKFQKNFRGLLSGAALLDT
jgi:hypothetical protein